MRPYRGPFLLILVGLLLSVTVSRLTGGTIQLADAFPHLTFTKPIFLTHPGDGTNRLFVVQQNGIVLVFDNDPATTSTSVFLDVSAKLSARGGEEGLLGFAVHPQFVSNGIFFINYTTLNPLRSVIARYHVSASNPLLADTSEEVLLEVNQPYINHNGGMLAFGPDGCLYISLGDGGSGGDPLNNAQSLTTLLGKILRIDVNSQSQGKSYAIPADNPFKGNLSGYREEIWAYGLRNPWRFSFDRVTGQLWAGDVGQGEREEVDVIEKGKNYGWHIMEGFACYAPATGCDKTGLTLPIVDYSHTEGVAITGGYVYRGSRCPDLSGAYIFGDYGTRKIWRLQTEAGQVKSDSLLLVAPGLVSSFGEDKSGELYVTTYSSSTTTKIYRFDQSTATSVQGAGMHPDGFYLAQNYPNPFNPKTVISCQLPAASTVRLVAYDVLGREAAILLDEQMEAGTHEISFDGSGLSSGVYVYRLTAGEFVQSRKMLLQR
jgi:glucose/arabinose dehydrogenase